MSDTKRRESYWDYMGRKIRENRNVELSLVEKVKSLEERVKKLEALKGSHTENWERL